jgi:hypothetical protein
MSPGLSALRHRLGEDVARMTSAAGGPRFYRIRRHERMLNAGSSLERGTTRAGTGYFTHTPVSLSFSKSHGVGSPCPG